MTQKAITFSLTDEDSDIMSFLNTAKKTSGLSRTNIIKQALRAYAREVASNGKMTFYVNPEVFNNSVRETVIDKEVGDEPKTQAETSQNAPDSTAKQEQESTTEEPEKQEEQADKPDTDLIKKMILNGGIQAKSSKDVH